MLNRLKNDWRSHIIFTLMVIMLSSLFFSRDLLTYAMMGFVICSLLHSDIKNQFRKFISSPLLWGMSLLFFLPLFSGLWSDDKMEWLNAIRIKLPLLFLPLAFAGPFTFSKKEWERLAVFFILLSFCGTAWVMINYLSDTTAVHKGYLQSKLIKTPLWNDHVRFSWMVSIAAFLSGWLSWKKRKTNPVSSMFLFIAVVWMIIFLHLLAARMGLLSFYIISFSITLWLVFKKLKSAYGIAILLILISLPFVAYFALPTFQNRVKYFFYDLPYFKEAHYLPQTTDAVRVISWKAGWNVMNENSVTGTGFGDISSLTKKWYSENYPQMNDADKIYPSSEWLMYGTGCGWFGFIFFTIIMAIPFLIKNIHNRFLWCVLNASAACSLLFDIGLSVQFGVFLYSFIVLCWWKSATLNSDNPQVKKE